MKASVCIATYNKPRYLRRVLESIICQCPPFDWEIIIVDDGSPTDETAELCREYSEVRFIPRWRSLGYGNPGAARNIAYRAARGEVLICQSDDVVHANGNTIATLVGDMRPGQYVVATVVNTDWDLKPTPSLHPANPQLIEFSGPQDGRGLLFLGAVYRHDVYAIGGNDERFTAPGYEDTFFVDCLRQGLGLQVFYSQVEGYHLHHERPSLDATEPSRVLYNQLKKERRWRTETSPWPQKEKKP